MNVSKSARREAKQLFTQCMVDGVLDENRVRAAVRKVAAARGRGYMSVLLYLQRLVKLELQRRAARVESPVPMPEHLQQQIVADLNRLYGRGLRISFAQNPDLIGGLRVKVGSDVYDGTIRARLEKLSLRFSTPEL